MIGQKTVSLIDLMVRGQRSLNPKDFPDEEFELFSIPAYDMGKPEHVLGDKIGSTKKMVNPGDLLLSRIVPHIRRAWVVPSCSERRQIASGEWIVFRHESIEPRYLRHLFIGNQFHAQFMNTVAGVGGSLVRARPDNVGKIQIPLPPLSEQKRIADILDKADAIRRKRQEALAMIESDLLASAFRDHFGDARTNPKGWPIEQLGNVINFVGGSQPPKETFVNEPKPGYVRLVQIRDFKTDKYPTYIPKELAKRQFVKDDVMIARYGPPVFQILRGLEGSYNVALMKAENTNRTTKDFIFYLLQIPEIHDVVVANSQRTAGQSGMNMTLLNSLEIPIPPIDEQIKIVQVLKSIEMYQAKANSYFKVSKQLFESLVQRAFKGEL